LLLAGRFDGSDEHGGDLACLVAELVQWSLWGMLRFVEKFEPVFGFIGFFLCDRHLRKKLGSGLSMTGSSVVRSNRRG
jgi:hypothetical protein